MRIDIPESSCLYSRFVLYLIQSIDWTELNAWTRTFSLEAVRLVMVGYRAVIVVGAVYLVNPLAVAVNTSFPFIALAWTVTLNFAAAVSPAATMPGSHRSPHNSPYPTSVLDLCGDRQLLTRLHRIALQRNFQRSSNPPGRGQTGR